MLAEEGAAIEVVYARHWARLERQLTWITRDATDGQELAAEVFARLSHEIAAGRTPANPDAWLHRVGRNLAASRGRHLVVIGRRAAQLAPPPQPQPPESLVEMAETWAEIERAINNLAPSERRVVALAARGYDSAEIGIAVGRTAGAVRTLLCRSRAKLRERLREAGVVVGAWLLVLASDGSIQTLIGS